MSEHSTKDASSVRLELRLLTDCTVLPLLIAVTLQQRIRTDTIKP
jgi:hypothetical protein